MAKQVLMPEARLEPRGSDVEMTNEQFLKIGLFSRLKRAPTLSKFPGALVLRRFRKGEVIFRQGEAGWTAFYILTSEDLLAIQETGKQALPSLHTTLSPEEARSVMMLVQQIRANPDKEEDLRAVATVNLSIGRPSSRKGGGFWKRLQRGFFSGQDQKSARPAFIPIDGPRDLNSDTLQSNLYEGELFGEMGCLYRSPRSATVVAKRDCYMLEMLRHILDQLQKDTSYREQTEKTYKERVFQLYLRQLGIFADLTEQQFAEIRPGLDLKMFEPGQVIFDEHERSDSMYVVRSGLVRIVKKISALLSPENIRTWKNLGTTLREGEKQPATPAGKIWQLLAESAKALLRGKPDAFDLSPQEKEEVLYALNDVIKQPTLADAKEFQPVVAGPTFKALTEDLPKTPRKGWSDQEVRRFHRHLLETVFAGSIRQYRPRIGPECVLSYCSRGDFIGEIGLFAKQSRIATCIAYGHPQEDDGKDAGQVELVKVPGPVFQRMLELNPRIREKMEKEIAARQKQNKQVLAAAVWEDTNQVMHSPRFEELGLIQGQRLMLIDLDRCTRCDECVKACVNVHDDGRSRLFLDGPRFDKYLVPTTCRSCLDPVCMIGCPVGSIHRGNNGEIEIEDWCIGCGLCAKGCPYGSIQMHDIGVIPAAARGWRFLPAGSVTSAKWMQSSFGDHEWALGDAPFLNNRMLRDQLGSLDKKKEGESKVPGIYFRLEFRANAFLFGSDSQFKLELTSADPSAVVWINGQEIEAATKPNKKGIREYHLPLKEPASQPLRAGRNVLAVKLTPLPGTDLPLLDVRLDAINKPKGAADAKEEVEEKVVVERAVVCDLCSSLPGQVPACVNACPHDAAMRVDARFEFPMK